MARHRRVREKNTIMLYYSVLSLTERKGAGHREATCDFHTRLLKVALLNGPCFPWVSFSKNSEHRNHFLVEVLLGISKTSLVGLTVTNSPYYLVLGYGKTVPVFGKEKMEGVRGFGSGSSENAQGCGDRVKH